jgi:hypothetical protein
LSASEKSAGNFFVGRRKGFAAMTLFQTRCNCRSFRCQQNCQQMADGGTFASTRGIGITGLTRGKDYWARIRAVGPNGPGAWSDPATILVA